MGCKSCDLVYINGVACHETGCPDKNLNADGKYLHTCSACGFEVESDDRYRFECDCYVDVPF